MITWTYLLWVFILTERNGAIQLFLHYEDCLDSELRSNYQDVKYPKLGQVDPIWVYVLPEGHN